MSDTKAIETVETVDRDDMHVDVQVPYTPNVKERFKVVAEYEIEQIKARARQAIDQIRAREADEIRQWGQMAAHVEKTVPEPMLRIGHEPPYVIAPDWADDTDAHVEAFDELHDAQDARDARDGRVAKWGRRK